MLAEHKKGILSSFWNTVYLHGLPFIMLLHRMMTPCHQLHESYHDKTDFVNNDLDSDERMVFDVVRQMSGATMEEIINGTGFSPGLANSLVTVMEIKGIVESYAGRIYLSR